MAKRVGFGAGAPQERRRRLPAILFLLVWLGILGWMTSMVAGIDAGEGPSWPLMIWLGVAGLLGLGGVLALVRELRGRNPAPTRGAKPNPLRRSRGDAADGDVGGGDSDGGDGGGGD